jgi:hypothetical protein
MCVEMVVAYLQAAKKDGLLNANGHEINMSVE